MDMDMDTAHDKPLVDEVEEDTEEEVKEEIDEEYDASPDKVSAVDAEPVDDVSDESGAMVSSDMPSDMPTSAPMSAFAGSLMPSIVAVSVDNDVSHGGNGRRVHRHLRG
jgi:hypothetical protein